METIFTPQTVKIFKYEKFVCYEYIKRMLCLPLRKCLSSLEGISEYNIKPHLKLQLQLLNRMPVPFSLLNHKNINFFQTNCKSYSKYLSVALNS